MTHVITDRQIVDFLCAGGYIPRLGSRVMHWPIEKRLRHVGQCVIPAVTLGLVQKEEEIMHCVLKEQVLTSVPPGDYSHELWTAAFKLT